MFSGKLTKRKVMNDACEGSWENSVFACLPHGLLCSATQCTRIENPIRKFKNRKNKLWYLLIGHLLVLKSQLSLSCNFYQNQTICRVNIYSLKPQVLLINFQHFLQPFFAPSFCTIFLQHVFTTLFFANFCCNMSVQHYCLQTFFVTFFSTFLALNFRIILLIMDPSACYCLDSEN